MAEERPFGEGLVRRFGGLFDLVLPRRAAALARKETRHVLRDPYSLAMSLALPLVMVFLFGYAISFDMRDLRLGVRDDDRSRALRPSNSAAGTPRRSAMKARFSATVMSV